MERTPVSCRIIPSSRIYGESQRKRGRGTEEIVEEIMDEKFPNLMKPVSKKLNEPQAQLPGDRLEVEEQTREMPSLLAQETWLGYHSLRGRPAGGAGTVGSLSALGTQMEVSRAAGMMGLAFRRQWTGDRSPGGHGLGGSCRRELRARGRPQDTPSVNQEAEPEGHMGS